MFCFKVFIFSAVMFAANCTHAQDNPWEISFGSTQMFSGWYSKEVSHLPTSSMTAVLSYEILESITVWGVFNLPLVPNQKLTSEGLIVQNQTPPALMLGGSFQPILIEVKKDRDLGIDLGASIGKEIALSGRFFPVGAARLKLIIDDSTTVYAGVTTSPYNADGDLLWGLIYGVGTKF